MRAFTSLTATALAVLGLAAVASTAQAATIIDRGHADVINVTYTSGGLDVDIHYDDSHLDPATTELVVLPQAETAVPTNPAYSFLGDPGDPVWILPQVQDPDLLWPGWSTEGVADGVLVGDTLTVTLTAVSGPGDIVVYRSGLTPTVLFRSGDGLPDALTVGTGAHAHANWAFTAPGDYNVTFTVTAIDAATGVTISSGPIPYSFVVRT